MEVIYQSKRSPRILLSAFIPLIWVLLMWVVYIVNLELSLGWKNFGLVPRDLSGALGILTSPLLHSNIEHIVNNSIPALLLGWIMFYFYQEVAGKVLAISWLATGVLVWITARYSMHIGASGVVYALTAFLFVSGFLRRHKSLMAISFLVTFLYGGMIWGILPIPDNGISWESHLWGGLVGLTMAVVYRKIGLQKPVRHWPEEDDDDDDPNAPWLQPQNVAPRAQAQQVTVIYHRPGEAPKPLDPGNSDMG